jgi:hypothetical protein
MNWAPSIFDCGLNIFRCDSTFGQLTVTPYPFSHLRRTYFFVVFSHSRNPFACNIVTHM